MVRTMASFPQILIGLGSATEKANREGQRSTVEKSDAAVA